MPLMQLEGVGKSFASAKGTIDVLAGVDLKIERGELVAIVGFSGSGKTTLLSLMAGLEPPTAGTVRFRGNTVAGPAPERAVVFQNYSLMPWLSVEGNVALAVDCARPRRTRAHRRRIVAHYIEMVGLGDARERRPAELSGGMRQRVAVARALAMEPEMLLLDEPLAALDALTRARLQDEIDAIRAREGTTIVLITNDVDEAVLLADRVVPLEPGPRARLGPEFAVGIERPRERAAVNAHPQFRRLRADVTRHLLDAARDAEAADPGAEAAGPDGLAAPGHGALPDVVPLASGAPPRAYVEAAESPPMRHYVEFSQVSKTYPTRRGPLTVVDGFGLRMNKGEFVSLIGHSGCGKSTVLSMAAGLTEPSGGGIIVDGREVTDAGPERAVVFQAPSLLPWLTAAGNVALGVDRVYPHARAAERAEIVDYYLRRVGLARDRDTLAADLSSGMRQRVGVARAFALSPKLLLLDEPFGMLDSLTRWELQELLMEVWTRTRVTAICVTHDVDEAILLADRVVMMTDGPNATVGKVVEVNLPRPRTRKDLVEHPDYYACRQQVLEFLADGRRADSAAADAA